jgi:hypothetical protein
LTEGARKRRTAYSSGRRELAGLPSIKGALHPEGRKTTRKWSKREKMRAQLGFSVDRTPFKAKLWKREK